jgi:hypothetical protein
VTKATASGYRNGKSVPHPSYWLALGDWCLSRVEMLAIRSQMSQNYR